MIDNDRLNHSLAIARKMVEIYYIVTTLCDKKEIANKIQETLLSKRLISGCQISERNQLIGGMEKLKRIMNII